MLPLTLQLRRARTTSGAPCWCVVVNIDPSLPRRIAAPRIAHLQRRRKSDPIGYFALAFGFVRLIFLVFPASVRRSDRSENHFTVFRAGADTSGPIPKFFILIEAATLIMRDDCR